MNYIYDVSLNLAEKFIPFYEWNRSDSIESFEKIGVCKVSHRDFVTIKNHMFKVSQDFLESIKATASLKDSAFLKAVDYAVIFTDEKSAIAIEFDTSGLSIKRSDLLLSDDLNILELAYSMNRKKILYETLNLVESVNELREEKRIKNIIEEEIKNLLTKKDINKLKYLYLEWFRETESDPTLMYNRMKDALNDKISDREIKVYEIINLSHSKV